jgi:hypothetical protein
MDPESQGVAKVIHDHLMVVRGVRHDRYWPIGPDPIRRPIVAGHESLRGPAFDLPEHHGVFPMICRDAGFHGRSQGETQRGGLLFPDLPSRIEGLSHHFKPLIMVEKPRHQRIAPPIHGYLEMVDPPRGPKDDLGRAFIATEGLPQDLSLTRHLPLPNGNPAALGVQHDSWARPFTERESHEGGS